MQLSDILVCVTNHNNNENSIKLKKDFSEYIDTIIIDSGSNNISDEFNISLNNVYYSGLFNESVKQTKQWCKKYLFFIASDVYVHNIPNIIDNILLLEDDIYLYSPSSRGQSHYHCKNMKSDSIREVPYLEGFCFLVNMECVYNLNTIDLNKNLFGYGVDLILGYNCVKTLGKKCVIDDRVEIYHKEGTGYNQQKALTDMYNWMLNEFSDDVKEYTYLYSRSWDSTINSSDYTKLLNYLKL